MQLHRLTSALASIFIATSTSAFGQAYPPPPGDYGNSSPSYYEQDYSAPPTQAHPEAYYGTPNYMPSMPSYPGEAINDAITNIQRYPHEVANFGHDMAFPYTNYNPYSRQDSLMPEPMPMYGNMPFVNGGNYLVEPMPNYYQPHQMEQHYAPAPYYQDPYYSQQANSYPVIPEQRPQETYNNYLYSTGQQNAPYTPQPEQHFQPSPDQQKNIGLPYAQSSSESPQPFSQNRGTIFRPAHIQ